MSQSLKYPTALTSVSENPYDDNAWANPTNAGGDDGNYASITAASFDSPDYSEILKAIGLGFEIPTNAIINGIFVEMECYNDSGETGKDVIFQLTKDGAARVGDNKAKNANWNTSPTVLEYGGSSDLWGTTWTASEINASTFGVHMANQATTANADIYVDFIRVTVDYTIPPDIPKIGFKHIYSN